MKWGREKQCLVSIVNPSYNASLKRFGKAKQKQTQSLFLKGRQVSVGFINVCPGGSLPLTAQSPGLAPILKLHLIGQLLKLRNLLQ